MIEIETLVFGGGLVIALIYFLSKSNSQKTKTERSNNRKTRTTKSNKQKIETAKVSTQKGRYQKPENRKTRTTKSSKIPDSKVSVKQLLKDLKKMTLKKEPKYYKEDDIELQLEKQLKTMYENVDKQHTLEGGKQIDFNIGHGKVGVELKLAKSLYRYSVERDRIVGQLQGYIEAKYDNENLIAVVAGEKKHLDDSSNFKKVKKIIEKQGAHFIFLEIEE